MTGSYAAMSFASDSARKRIAEIQRLLTERPQTVNDLCIAMDVKRKAMQPYMRRLRPQMHVSGWEASLTGMGQAYLRMWVWGAGEDAPQPEPERTEENWPKRTGGDFVPRRDPMVAAFFGPAGA